MITLKGVDARVRQIAIRNIGRDEPTLLITNELTAPAKDLFARYAERMIIENELDAYIGGFHLDALSSAVPLNVDLDTTLTVRRRQPLPPARPRTCPATNRHPGHALAPLPRHRRHPARHRGHRHLRPATYAATTPSSSTPASPTSNIPIPWWEGRTLRFRFPPR